MPGIAAAAAAFAPLLALGLGMPEPQGAPVSLPQVLTDGSNFTWDIQANGAIGDGTRDAYDSSSQLYFGEMPLDIQVPVATALGSGREIVIGPLPATAAGMTPQPAPAGGAAGLRVTRRIRVPAEAPGFCRFVEVFENASQAQVPLTFTVRLDLGSDNGTQIHVTSSGDTTVGQDDVALITHDGGRGQNDPVLVHFFGSRTAGPHMPRVDTQRTGIIDYVFQNIALARGAKAVFIHFEMQRATLEEAEEALRTFNPAQHIADLPADLRAALLNFPPSGSAAAPDAATGPARDPNAERVELRSGDRLAGEVTDASFAIDTLAGAFELPRESIAMIEWGETDPGDIRIRTESGDVHAGVLRAQRIHFRPATGQALELVPDTVRRITFRARPGSGAEPPAPATTLELRSGDVLRGVLSDQALALVMPYATAELGAAHVRELQFEQGDARLQRVVLQDGSSLTGFLRDDAIRFRLESGREVSVRREVARVLRCPERALASAPPEDLRPRVTFRNGDAVVGFVRTQAFDVVTAYGTVHVDPRQALELTFDEDAWLMVQVKLWDGTTISGRVSGVQELAIETLAGARLQVFVAEVATLVCPTPLLPVATEQRIAALIEQLSDDDYDRRDEAQEALKRIGRPVLRALYAIQDHPDSEVRYRVLKIIEEVRQQE